MIKELRIGNWVGTFKPHTVNAIYLSHFTAVDESGLQHNSQQYNLLPIPLTSEILEKVGFEWNGGDHWADKENLFWIENRGHDYRFCKPMVTPYNIRNMHQLQNLYFALTGNELEINL